MAQSNCALTVDQEGSDAKGTDSRASLYFDSLAPELVAGIVAQIDDDAKIELLQCDGELGGTLPRSVISLFANVIEGVQVQYTKYVEYEFVPDNEDGGLRNLKSMEEGKNVVVAWNRCFYPDTHVFIGLCGYLRSLKLDFSGMNHSEIISFDPLFATCGSVLEELSLQLVRGRMVKSITASITRHCRVLNSLSCHGVEFVTPFVPLFRAVGVNLRKLDLVVRDDESLADLARWFPVLEDVKLDGCHASFAVELHSPLKVIRFRSTPNVDDLKTLIEKRPDVMIHLHRLSYGDLAQGIGRASSGQLQSLDCFDWFQDFGHTENVVGSLSNLEVLSIVRTGQQDFIKMFLDAFFISPKPKLRKLFVTGVICSSIFDYLASNTSNLEEFTCIYYETNGIGDTEMYSLLSANESLRKVVIHYGVGIDENTGLNPLSASILQQTALLIRNLKMFPFLRQLKVRFASSTWVDGNYWKIIADACVGLRGRGTSVVVGDVTYL